MQAIVDVWERQRETRLGSLLLSPLPVFVALLALLLVVHEPWRDEAQPWVLVRDAPNFFAELDSEASPPLWYVLLAPLAKLGLPFMAARVLHLVLAAAALAVFVASAPFSREEKWMFSLGYFVVFEYGAIARSYVLVPLLLFLVAAFWSRRHERPLLHGALLLLLASATAHGTILALVLGAAFVVELALRRNFRVPAVAGALLPFLGAAAAFWVMLPGADLGTWRTQSNFELGMAHFVATAEAVLSAFLPIPYPQWAWGAGPLLALPGGAVLALGALAYAGSCLFFLRNRRILALYLAASLPLLAAFYLKHQVGGEPRHHGVLFFLLIFCLWLQRLETRATAPPGAADEDDDASEDRFTKLTSSALAMMLMVHVVGAGAAVFADAQQPFSGGEAAAAHLKAAGLDSPTTLVAAFPSFIGPAVLVHLDQVDRIYYPQTDSMGSYVRWTELEAITRAIPLEAITRQTMVQASEEKADRVVLLMPFPVGDPGFTRMWEMQGAYGSLASDDDVYIYVAK